MEKRASSDQFSSHGKLASSPSKGQTPKATGTSETQFPSQKSFMAPNVSPRHSPKTLTLEKSRGICMI